MSCAAQGGVMIVLYGDILERSRQEHAAPLSVKATAVCGVQERLAISLAAHAGSFSYCCSSQSAVHGVQECLANGPAWDTLTWFAALIAMAAYLNKFGFIPWFSDR